MKIYVDADACPVIKQIEKMAKKYNIKSVLISDTNHILSSEYSDVIVVDKGADSADFFIINACSANDIIVTQDYGVAAMALARKAHPINQNGVIFTNDNISEMLMKRHMRKKAVNSKQKCHIKGPPKRTKEDNINFSNALELLILSIINV